MAIAEIKYENGVTLKMTPIIEAKFDTMKMTEEEVIKFAKIYAVVVNSNPVKFNCLTNLLLNVHVLTRDESRVLEEDEKERLDSSINLFKFMAS